MPNIFYEISYLNCLYQVLKYWYYCIVPYQHMIHLCCQHRINEVMFHLSILTTTKGSIGSLLLLYGTIGMDGYVLGTSISFVSLSVRHVSVSCFLKIAKRIYTIKHGTPYQSTPVHTRHTISYRHQNGMLYKWLPSNGMLNQLHAWGIPILYQDDTCIV